MLVQSNVSNKRKTVSVTNIAVMVLFAMSLLVGFAPKNLIALGVIVASMLLCVDNKIYLGLPFVLFYYEFYGTFVGMSVYRVYSILLLLLFLFTISVKRKVNMLYMFPLLIYILYDIMVVIPYGMQKAVFVLVDIVCVLVIIFDYLLADKKNLKSFFKVYAGVSLCSYISGFIGKNNLEMEVYGESIDILRYMATFEDPNYMGFFFTIGIFSVVSLNLFKPIVRVPLVITLYVMLFSSSSITAIVVNAILWLFYLFITKKINLKTLVVILVAVFVLVKTYYYGLENPQSKFFGSMSYRVEEKLEMLNQGDVDSLTTGRTAHSKIHMEYFLESPWYKQLLGGTPVNTSFISPEFEKAAHNEYIDWLLNIGILGTIVMISFLIYRFAFHLRTYLRTREPESLFIVMMKAVWMCYAATLTIFLDFRFMIPFFI